MRILVTGATGMIGRKLCARLAADGAIDGQPIEAAHLLDVVAPAPPAGAHFATLCEALDVAMPSAAAKAIAAREHSAGAYRPRLIYASTVAVFGAPFPETIDDDFLAAPLTSYGAQKAMVELLIADYSRRGLFDGVALRLPTVVVRPGPANRAASGFFSSIIREPLCGREAILPMPDTTPLWCASPRAAVGSFVHAAALDLAALGPRRSLTMPGISTTVGEQIEALRRVGGDSAVRRIHRQPDESSARIVSGWPGRFAARRALALGFAAESSFDEIVRVYLEDDHVPAVA
jgi:nucleoside-diphosphate-sugar epimerase